MISRNRSRRTLVATTATALAIAVSIFAFSSPASAENAAPEVATAINLKFLNVVTTGVGQAYFATWETGPNMTPDRVGGFAFWHGPSGQGAIYSHYDINGLVTAMVYGEIERAWVAGRWETGFGYPMQDETGTQFGCPSGTQRSQRFHNLANENRWLACWSPNFTNYANHVRWIPTIF